MKKIILILLLIAPFSVKGQGFVQYAEKVADSIGSYTYPDRVEAVLKIRDLVAAGMKSDSASLVSEANEKLSQAANLANYLSQLNFQNQAPPNNDGGNDGGIDDPPPPQTGDVTVFIPDYKDFQTCDDWVRFRMGAFELENNVWGKSNAISLQACMSADAAEKTWGMKWNANSSKNNVLTYQQIIWWYKPWHRGYQLIDSPLPKFKDIEHLKLNFKFSTQSTGKHNHAMEFWALSSIQPNSVGSLEDHIVKEVMIWHVETERFGNSEAYRATIDGREWRVSDSGQYMAFLPVGNFYEGSINVKKFIDWLIDNGKIDREHYISGIEHGTEVINGSGETTVSDFSIEYKGPLEQQVEIFTLDVQRVAPVPVPISEREAMRKIYADRQKRLQK